MLGLPDMVKLRQRVKPERIRPPRLLLPGLSGVDHLLGLGSSVNSES